MLYRQHSEDGMFLPQMKSESVIFTLKVTLACMTSASFNKTLYFLCPPLKEGHIALLMSVGWPKLVQPIT